MDFPLPPLAFVALLLAGWVNRQQQGVIQYLLEENRVLWAAHGPRRICRRAVYAAIDRPDTVTHPEDLIPRCASVEVDVLRGFGPDVSQFYHDVPNGQPQVYDSKDGEMLERPIRHAWKTKGASDINPLRSAPTHTRSAT